MKLLVTQKNPSTYVLNYHEDNQEKIIEYTSLPALEAQISFLHREYSEVDLDCQINHLRLSWLFRSWI